jgi:GxxExxY protein
LSVKARLTPGLFLVQRSEQEVAEYAENYQLLGARDDGLTRYAQNETVEINELIGLIIGSAMRVHSAVGPGLLESVYRACLQYELEEHGLQVRSEFPIPVVYRGVQIDVGHRVDLLVSDLVLVELKAQPTMHPVYEAQLLSYLRMSNRPMGLLINFHVVHLRNGIRRMTNQIPRKSN